MLYPKPSIDNAIGDLSRAVVGQAVAPPISEYELWHSFWERRDNESRNRLLLAYASVVDQVVDRLPGAVQAYWDRGDLVSFGTFGLIEAISRFDPDSTLQNFRRYSSKRVRGAIFDELRRLDWLPRTVRRRVISYRTTVDSLSSDLQRVPSRDEVFSSLSVKPKEGAELLIEVRSSQFLHLDHPKHQEDDLDIGQTLKSEIAHDVSEEPEYQFLAAEELSELKDAIAQLPERQRAVVNLHFLSGLTQNQIGQLLGITSSRVCQIEADAMRNLRKSFAKHEREKTA